MSNKPSCKTSVAKGKEAQSFLYVDCKRSLETVSGEELIMILLKIIDPEIKINKEKIQAGFIQNNTKNILKKTKEMLQDKFQLKQLKMIKIYEFIHDELKIKPKNYPINKNVIGEKFFMEKALVCNLTKYLDYFDILRLELTCIYMKIYYF